MALVLDLKPRKEAPAAASAVVMEPISTSLEHDLFLAAISVVPAAIIWIALDHLFLGLVLGVSIFLVAEYGVPAYRAGTIDLTPAYAFFANIRDIIRSRGVRRA